MGCLSEPKGDGGIAAERLSNLPTWSLQPIFEARTRCGRCARRPQLDWNPSRRLGAFEKGAMNGSG
jgi:hypothetical protein